MSYKYTVGGTYKSRNRDELDRLRQKYIDTTQNYDPSKDTGYQEYAKMMREQGQLATEDTVGKSAAATGGYGNSYAQTAGQQVYNDYARDITAAQDTFYDRALSRIAGEMNMLESREAADKAAWEEDYLDAISDAQRAGDTATLAKIYGYKDANEYKASLRTALPEEEVDNFIRALSEGKGDDYFDYLVDKGYNTDDLYTEASARSYRGDSGEGRILVGKDENGKAVQAVTSFELNDKIRGLKDSHDVGEKFHVAVTGDNYDVQLGQKIEPTEGLRSIADQFTGKGDSLFVYNGTLYFTDGTSTLIEVEAQSGKTDELDKLIQAIRKSQLKTEE